MSAKKVAIKELTARLNKMLESFNMKATEEWSRGKLVRWHISKRNSFKAEVATLMPDLTVLAVNPDGPKSLNDCVKIVATIEADFSVKTERIHQMSSQGGR